MQKVPIVAHPISAIRLVGGRPALDFVNSVHDWTARECEDYIATPERYLDWARRCGLLDFTQHVPDISDPDATNLMRAVAALRDALFRIFNAAIDDCALPESDLAILNEWLHRAWAARELDANGALGWRADAHDAWLPLKGVALSAIKVLGDIPPSRLKRCGAPTGCGWLFEDNTRNNLRRWCAMETCGTNAKMARYRGKGATGGTRRSVHPRVVAGPERR